jgi:POTRA domain, FtsQ-type
MKPPLQKRQDWIRGRREKRKLTRQARLRRQVFRYSVLCLLICVAVAGFIYLPWAIGSAERDITIHGNHVATDSQIRDALRSAVRTPLYRVDPKKLEDAVCALPIVKYAFVRRAVFPHPHLSVEVLEEFPWATYCSSPENPPEKVISQSGRMIPIKDFPSVVQPSLRFCGGSDFHLTAADIVRWDQWVRLISKQLDKPVELVDMRKPNQICVGCPGVDLQIGQADSSLTHRLNRLASVVPVTATLQDKLEYIDLSLDSNIPLKVDKSAASDAREDELLKQAVRRVATTQ